MILVYGSHELEINEEIHQWAQKSLPSGQPSDGIYTFDCDDFLKADHHSLTLRIQDFRNAVETVSFFSNEKVIILKNLQLLPKKKSPIEKIETELGALHLVKLSGDASERWFDRDSLALPPHGHQHITARHLLEEIEPTQDKGFYCKISLSWKDRFLWVNQGDSDQKISVKDYLTSKLKSKVVFEPPGPALDVNQGSTHQLLKQLLLYLEDPIEGVTFLLSALIKKPEELPKPLAKALQKSGKLIKKTVSYDLFLPHSWVLNRAKTKGLRFTPESAGLFVEIVGNNLHVLDQELDKILLKYGEGASPTQAELIETASHSKGFSIFLVGQYLADRDLKNALDLIRTLLREKKNESLPLLGLISYYFRRLLKIRWLLDQGLSPVTIGDRLSQKPWQLKGSLTQVRNFQATELENIVIELSDRDLMFKQSSGDSLRIMEDLAFLICRGRLSVTLPSLQP